MAGELLPEKKGELSPSPKKDILPLYNQRQEIGSQCVSTGFCAGDANHFFPALQNLQQRPQELPPTPNVAVGQPLRSPSDFPAVYLGIGSNGQLAEGYVDRGAKAAVVSSHFWLDPWGTRNESDVQQQ